MNKHLWVPLKSEYFLAFERGTKSIEYRLYGAQWNERTCWVGRDAILGHGYSGRRLRAIVTAFETRTMDSEIYGPARVLALIHLQVLGPLEADESASPKTGNLFPT